ncbi:MAG: S49 family peptidase [Alphaproteobacteria bacterium]
MEHVQEARLKKQPQNKTKNFFSWINFPKLINSCPNIAVLRMQGVISASSAKFSSNLSLENLTNSINEAFSLSNLKAVVLQINCPGGSPVQSELIFKYIRFKADKKNIPVIACIEDVAASGGLYLTYAADEVYALQSSIVGSIGVITTGFGFYDAIKKLGIERRIYTQGENKSVLDPFLPEKESDIKIIHGIQKDIHENFKNFLRERRAGKLTADEDKLFSGEFWSGKEAIKLGLIDYIGDMNTVINDKFGDKAKIKMINTEKSWFKRKFRISNIIENITDKIYLIIKEKFELNKLGL